MYIPLSPIRTNFKILFKVDTITNFEDNHRSFPQVKGQKDNKKITRLSIRFNELYLPSAKESHSMLHPIKVEQRIFVPVKAPIVLVIKKIDETSDQLVKW